MNRRQVVNIAEHDHFADYAELQQPSHEQPRSDFDYFWVGLGILVACSISAAFWVGLYEWRIR